MPSGGQTTDELIILQWEKKVGDPIKRGDTLFEIETDKANLTVESYADGTLLEIKYGNGARVKAGEVVAYIGEMTDKLPDAARHEESVSRKKNNPDAADVQNKTDDASTMLIKEANRIYASPLAKSVARIENIDLEDVASFVSRNLIKKDDITRYLTYLRNKDGVRNADEADIRDSYFLDLTPMRRTIARRMRQSLSVSPHYIVSVDIDMTDVVKLRSKLNDITTRSQLKISYNDIIMKAVANAISWHPLINSTYFEDKVQIHKNVNFGIAVGLEAGLLVPVIRNVNHKSVGQIATTSAEIIEKARNGKLSAADISGGTITLSNLGMYGMKAFTAIINQPESCILAVGAIIARPVAVDRKVKIRDMMDITASLDHRVIDGAAGAAFLQDVKKILENPQLLVL